MKKFLVAVAASFFIFGGQPDAQAASIENLDAQGIQTQEVGKWANIRDKYILNRETDKERRKRMEWERKHGYRPDHRKHRYDDDYPPPPPPPPPRGRHYDRDYPPPPPPPPPHRRY